MWWKESQWWNLKVLWTKLVSLIQQNVTGRERSTRPSCNLEAFNLFSIEKCPQRKLLKHRKHYFLGDAAKPGSVWAGAAALPDELLSYGLPNLFFAFSRHPRSKLCKKKALVLPNQSRQSSFLTFGQHLRGKRRKKTNSRTESDAGAAQFHFLIRCKSWLAELLLFFALELVHWPELELAQHSFTSLT